MTKRMWRRGKGRGVGLALAAAILIPAAAQAQITRVTGSDHHQSVGFTVGAFLPRAEESRVTHDVLVTDLDSLAFQIKDFTGATFGGEWLINVGDFLEAGVGAGFYQRTVPSVYANFTNTNGSEIQQDLKLRVVPMTATVRFLPIGHAKVEPYVGAGIGVFNWRYSEVGEFVDFDVKPPAIFRSHYNAQGNAVGPVILAGLRAPVGDVFAIGGEIRYQKATGDTKPADSGLLDSKIDLGGWTTNVTFHLRF